MSDKENRDVWGGRRRAWTMRNNVAKQMPSRHGQGTISSKRDVIEDVELLEMAPQAPSAGEVEEQADVIVRQMEQDPALMRDNPHAEQLRKEALRELPQCLTLKRSVRAKISASVSMKSKYRPISPYKRMKYRISFAFNRLRRRTKDLLFSIELWYDSIRTIEGHFGSAVGSYFYFLRNLFIINSLLSLFVCCFIIVPQILHDQYAGEAVEAVTTNVVLDVLSGQGILEDTVLFYGHYHSGTVWDSGYDMTFAYFFTMAAMYLMLFAVLSVRTAWLYRRNFIETAGALGQIYAAKVFCGWDFGIATRSAAANNSRIMFNELQELLSEQNKKDVKLSRCTRFGLLFVNIAMNLLVLFMISGFLALFWWLMDKWAGPQQGPYGSLAMAAIVTTVLTVGPLILSRIVRLESYEAHTSLYVTLARSFLLDASTLLLLLVYWFKRDYGCWETMLGQEVYRLVILDIIFSVVLIPMMELLRAIVYKRWFPDYGLEFDLAYNSLCLVYKQALLLLGMVFSPFLVIIISIELAVTFYIRRAVVMRACRPARKLWRSAQTRTALNLLVYLSLFSSLCVLGFVVIRSSSQQCGPFRRYEYVYMVVTEAVLELSHNHTLRRVLVFITRPGVIGLVLLLMCTGVYYARSRAKAQHSMVVILREMLALEAKDKEFLLSAIAKVSNGEWLYSRKQAATEQSHTWRYLHDDNVRKPYNAGFHLERPRDPHPRMRTSAADDGDTDSSFSWQGSGGRLDAPAQTHPHNTHAL